MESISYQGWPHCCRLSNGLIELIVTADIGPRIIHFGLVGESNEFWIDQHTAGLTGGDDYHLYGGHRLWHAPEERPRTYQPDNQPVSVAEADGGSLIVTQAVEAHTGIEKSLRIELSPDHARARITHFLTNRTLRPIECAPWAITMLAPGGTAIIPLPARGLQSENLQPVSSIAYWPYTDLSDPRFRFGGRYIMVAQDANAHDPQKIGVQNRAGWAAYARSDHVFVKGFDFDAGRASAYPDFGSTVEVYTDSAMLELETLAPLAVLGPGERAQHVETWLLLKDMPALNTDEDVDHWLLPHIAVNLSNGDRVLLEGKRLH